MQHLSATFGFLNTAALVAFCEVRDLWRKEWAMVHGS